MANAILPSGEQQFSDADGKPYVGGKVYFYIPNTLTKKDTYQTADNSVLNTNPVILDAAGRAVIWGNGAYRQILQDADGNTIWDKTVSYVFGTPPYIFSNTFDAAYAAEIGGYPKGAQVLKADGYGYWISTIDANSTDPDAGGAGWDSVDTQSVHIVETDRTGTTADVSAAIMAVIDAAADGDTVLIPRGIYKFPNLTALTKAVTLDFDDSELIVSPTINGVPAISFASELGGEISLTDCTEGLTTATLASEGDASSLSVGDWIVMGDEKTTYAWNDLDHDGIADSGSSINSSSYGKRLQINRIKKITGAALEFDLINEWSYESAEGAYVSKIINPIVGATVKNIKRMTQVDPGSGWASTAAGAHLIQFQNCIFPIVENVITDQFLRHAVNFTLCYAPYGSNNHASGALHPTSGGYGYLCRLQQSTDGIFENSTSIACRHTVDFNGAYNCKSINNVAMDPISIPFYCHGTGSKRCRSIGDSGYSNKSDSLLTLAGWGAGNSEFNADYDFTVVDPVLRGNFNYGLIARAGAKRTTLVRPDFQPRGGAFKGVAVFEGADGVTRIGGRIDLTYLDNIIGGVSGTAWLYAAANVSNSDTFKVFPKNVYWRDADGDAIAPGDGAQLMSGLYVFEMQGDLHVVGNRWLGTSGLSRGVNLRSNASGLTSIKITGNHSAGAFEYVIVTQVAPSGSYVVANNTNDATLATGFKSLASAPQLIDFMNGDSGLIPAQRFQDSLSITGNGSNRDLNFQTDAITRWSMRMSSGNDIAILRNNSAGTYIDTPFFIDASDGSVRMNTAKVTLGGAYNKPLILGTTYLWVTSGKLYINTSAPSSSTDGTVVGTQT